jgi:uncharacterized surface protein with fasciclin (FAS1) repeats
MLRTFALAVSASALIAGAPAFAQTAPPTADQTPPAATDQTMPPASAEPAVPEQQLIAPDPSADIVANLTASGHFTTLLKALKASGLTTLLQGATHSFTLFAPTDEAFAALPAGMLDNLLKPTNSAQLQQVIAYHIVATKLLPDQIRGHATTPVPTAINKPVSVDGMGATIKVNDANVIQAGAPASNGVIYVIDKVLTAPQ